MQIKFIILIFSLTLIVETAGAQLLSNPSFEGNTGFSVIPPGWEICDANSTPDTEPQAGNLLKPSHGSSFLKLVTRGNLGQYAYQCEDIQAPFAQALIAGKCYSLSVDLQYSKTLGMLMSTGEWLSYGNAVRLKIYGGNSSCGFTQLLAQTDAIENQGWQTYNFNILPQKNLYYFILRVDYVGDTIYFGNLYLDNIQLEKIEGQKIVSDTTVSFGTALELVASQGNNYEWFPADGLSCTDCPKALYDSHITTQIGVNITKNGCQHSELFNIRVLPFIPNTITPNGDGQNDDFHIDGLEENSSLQIMDRFGKLIFKTDNYLNNWDGRLNGTLLPTDTYWYTLKIPSNKEIISGYIFVYY